MRIGHTTTKTTNALAILGALAAFATVGVAISGCGASATLDPIARAAEVTSQQSGARISLTTRFSSSTLASGFAITANGYIDERDRSGEMTINLAGVPSASMLPGGGTGTMRMIFQYPVIYMNMPFLAGQLPEGKTWMKLDITKAAQAAGIDVSQLSPLSQTDPTQLLEYLRASSGGVTTVGSEPLYGEPTTHYHATLQLSSIIDRLPSAEQAAGRVALEKLGDADAIPVDVWVDAQGRVRRMQLSIGASVPAGTTGGEVTEGATISGTITIDFTSYGPVPPILPPPSSQVFDASAIAAAAGIAH